MLDPQKWKIAIARFNGYCKNVPTWIKTENVDDYHQILNALAEASGEDLSQFKIPDEKLRPRVTSVRPGGYGGGPGSVTYSHDKYCDPTFFRGQIDSLKHYLPTIQTSTRPKTKYDDLHDWQLEELMIQRRIKPQAVIENGRQVYRADREYLIAALVKQDNPPPRTPSTVVNVYDSNVNYESPGATITANVGDFSKEEFASVIDGLRKLLAEAPLEQPSQDEININIGTIELQLSSARPNASILKESLKSIKTILENTAGSLLASAMLPTVTNILNKF